MREAINRADAPGRRARLARLAAPTHGVPGITGVDTRALVRHIRDGGRDARRDLPGGEMPEAEARERVAAEPSMVGRDLAREVTVAERRVVEGEGDGPRIAALDTGIKHSIVRNFTARGVTLELYPARRPPTSCWRATPTASSSSPAPATPRRSTTSSTRSAR